MTRIQIIAATIAAVVVPFAFAWFINALYQMCLGFGWTSDAAGIFAAATTLIAWVCAVFSTIAVCVNASNP